MKRLLIAILILLIAQVAEAATRFQFTWEPNRDNVTAGYQLMMDGQQIKDIPGRETGATVYDLEDEAGKCYTFTMIAYTQDGVTSDPSNPVVWCSASEKPGRVIGLKIRVIVEQDTE